MCDSDEINLQIFKLLKYLTDSFRDAKKYDLLIDKTKQLSNINDKEQKELDNWAILKNSSVNRKTLFWSKLTLFSDIAWVDPFNPIKPKTPSKKSEKKNKAIEKAEREANLKAV